MKRLKAACLVIVMMALMVGSMVVTSTKAAAQTFQDVKSNVYYYEDVEHLLQLGAISKTEKFNPKNKVTRGQLAKMLAISLNLDTKKVKDPKFKDVPKKHQFYPYIAALVQEGIIKGYSDGNFGVNDQVKRSHLAKFVVEGYDLKQRSNYIKFSDVKVGTETDTYMKTLAFHVDDFTKITEYFYSNKDKNKNVVKPSVAVTRAEVAMFISKAVAAKERQSRELAIPLSEISPLEYSTDYYFVTLSGAPQTISDKIDILNEEFIAYGIEAGKSFLFTNTSKVGILNFEVDEALNITSYQLADEALLDYKLVTELRVFGIQGYNDNGNYETKVKEVVFTDRTAGSPITTTVKAKNADGDSKIVYYPKGINNLVEANVTYVDGSTETQFFYVFTDTLRVRSEQVEKGTANSVRSESLFERVNDLSEFVVTADKGQPFEIISSYNQGTKEYYVRGLVLTEPGEYQIGEEHISGVSHRIAAVKIDGILYAYRYYAEKYGIR